VWTPVPTPIPGNLLPGRVIPKEHSGVSSSATREGKALSG
jgi:hypothetical protein